MTIENSESTLFCGYAEVLERNKVVSNDVKSDIKLFKIELSQYYDSLEVLLKVLTPSEIERAQRYHYIKDSNRFIICRALLKIIIAEEKKLNVFQIILKKESNHKPYFPLDRSLFFNVSHAGDFALIAIGNCELGVDIEYINPDFKYEDILPEVFSTEEINVIRNAEVESCAFYQLWTRKEAIVKAIGKGIDEEFLNIPVSDGFHKIPASLVKHFKALNVESINFDDNYVGALAYTVKHKTLNFYSPPQVEELLTLLKE